MQSSGLMGVLAVIAVAVTGCAEPGCEDSGTICTVAGNGSGSFDFSSGGALDTALSAPIDVEIDSDGRALIVDLSNHCIWRLQDDRLEVVAGQAPPDFSQPSQPIDGPATSVPLDFPTHLSPAGDDGSFLIASWGAGVIGRYDAAAGQYVRLYGDGERDECGDGGLAVDASFDRPVQTAVDPQGRVYVLDQEASRVRRIDVDGTVETVVGSDPSVVDLCCSDGDGCTAPAYRHGFSGDGGSALGAYLALGGSLTGPAGAIALTPSGRTLYIADSGNHRVRRVLLDGDAPVIETIAGTGGVTCIPDESAGEICGRESGAFSADHLSGPRDVAVAADGSIYIADTFNHCVRRLDLRGSLTTVAGTCGYSGFDGDGGPAQAALLYRPYGVAISESGDLYIADTGNHRVRVVSH